MQIQRQKTRYKWPLLQSAFIAVPIFVLTALLPTLNPFYKLTAIAISVLIMTLSIVSYKSAKRSLKNIAKLAAIYYFAVIAAVFLIYYASSFLVLTDRYGVETLLQEHEHTAKAIFFAISFGQPILLPIPEAVTVVAGSSVFGSHSAFLLAYPATLAGITIMFYLSRVGGLKLIRRLVSTKRLEQYHHYVAKNETAILVLLFIIPVLPDEVICVGAGLSAVSPKRFLTIAAIAKFITAFTLAYSVEAAEALSLTASELTFLVTAALLVIYIGTMLIKKYGLKESQK
ncbi:TVP38/TMEM64 family protein [Bacillus marinisedimentorum]|uniref:TVP38/TMEM64 family protein n=1 Tax=Bacillus marinisedimentorum TaxID=1821260 RepID=UPI0007DF6EDE|nr:VTT domain-containing protein [Bacillus marinisedimentorum]